MEDQIVNPMRKKQVVILSGLLLLLGAIIVNPTLRLVIQELLPPLSYSVGSRRGHHTQDVDGFTNTHENHRLETVQHHILRFGPSNLCLRSALST